MKLCCSYLFYGGVVNHIKYVHGIPGLNFIHFTAFAMFLVKSVVILMTTFQLKWEGFCTAAL